MLRANGGELRVGAHSHTYPRARYRGDDGHVYAGGCRLAAATACCEA